MVFFLQSSHWKSDTLWVDLVPPKYVQYGSCLRLSEQNTPFAKIFCMVCNLPILLLRYDTAFLAILTIKFEAKS